MQEKEAKVVLPVNGTIEEQIAAVTRAIEDRGCRTVGDFYYAMRLPGWQTVRMPTVIHILPVLTEMLKRGLIERREVRIGTEERLATYHMKTEPAFIAPVPRRSRYEQHYINYGE